MNSIWFDLHPDRPTSRDVPLDALRPETVVVGAGLTGLAVGVLLARSGQDVVILEDQRVGAVTTGHTTAKLSLLQGSQFSKILDRHSPEMLGAYMDANREGQAWLRRFMDECGVEYQVRDAWTYATTEKGLKELEAEYEACRQVELAVEMADPAELPFEVAGALRLPDQVQIDPLLVLDALRAQFIEHGGVLVEGVRVTDATSSQPVEITTSRGKLTARQLILATGAPVLDRGGHFAKLVPQRSYVTMHRPTGAIPQGMYLSIDEPTRSLRTVETPEGQLLMVGGNGHVTGRTGRESEAIDGLAAWTGKHFPGAEMTQAWSAQDYEPHNTLPFAGPLPRGGGAIYAATGYNKWGMANAVAAALNLSQQILGGQMEWADVLNNPSVKLGSVADVVKNSAHVAGEMAKDWVAAELKPLPDEPPAEGEGVVGRVDGKPVARSTVGGVTCTVSGICSHMGGVLKWNDEASSWDCPLHGSRFTAEGTRLEGPAVADLDQLADPIQ